MSATGLAVLAELGDLVGIDVLNPQSSDWAILSNDNSVAIRPDSVLRFEYRNETRVPDYPLERGAFASFNRVQTPFDIRMVMVCEGTNYVQRAVSALDLGIGRQPMRRSDFLTTLDYMLDTTDLFTLVTPDALYKSVSLVHYDYRRESNNGAVMLIVEAWFQEIRLTAAAAYSTTGGVTAAQAKAPSGSDPASTGAVRAYAYGTNPTAVLQGVL